MTKIMLVEDDKSLREIYGVRLLAEGYDIVTAGNGEEALAMAIKERPHLIIADIMMPKISGFDMLDILRSTSETRKIKVIIMTALGSEEQRQRGEEMGADRYLVKSQVGIEDVVATVHDVLGDTPAAGGQPAPTDTPNDATATPSTPPTPTETPASSTAVHTSSSTLGSGSGSTLREKIIAPLENGDGPVDINDLLNKELAKNDTAADTSSLPPQPPAERLDGTPAPSSDSTRTSIPVQTPPVRPSTPPTV